MSLVYDQNLIKRAGRCRNSAPKACRLSELVTAYFIVDTMQTKIENALFLSFGELSHLFAIHLTMNHPTKKLRDGQFL